MLRDMLRGGMMVSLACMSAIHLSKYVAHGYDGMMVS